jgi:hypothetical protein
LALPLSANDAWRDDYLFLAPFVSISPDVGNIPSWLEQVVEVSYLRHKHPHA